jgi:hypothetical protein
MEASQTAPRCKYASWHKIQTYLIAPRWVFFFRRYPHFPGGCSPCPALPLAGVRRPTKAVVSTLAAHGFLRQRVGGDALVSSSTMNASKDLSLDRARAEYNKKSHGLSKFFRQCFASIFGTGKLAGSILGKYALLGRNKAKKASGLMPTRTLPVSVDSSRGVWQCSVNGKFITPGGGVLPHVTLEEALEATIGSLPLNDLLPHTFGRTQTFQNVSSRDILPRQTKRPFTAQIIHQTWTNRCIPERWAPFVATWGGQPQVKPWELSKSVTLILLLRTSY